MKNLEPKKPKGKLRAWLEKQKIKAKLWLYRYALLTGLGFVGLNAVDGYLTNYAHQLAVQSGIQRGIEANPFLAPIASHWALSFKGVLGLGVLAILARVRKATPNKLFLWLAIGCGVFLAIVIWNLYALRMI